ncbi:MAG: hypothetical protein B0A82_26740 [Alkalinema sp. CACIAM 70d]|nr:MAG: hypothetical protein B0A82_26740 [Alkalinema sp. CACIAM 70d]
MVRYRASSDSELTATPMQTVIANFTNHSTSWIITDSDRSPESDRSSKEDIDPGTLMILADIEAARDYYESCGRW